ncbi:Flagellar biosynthetic protein FlhB [bacterium HR40]|nr:Flagellar biosynthetic protein FlhB [bacterium HR40]
MAEHEEPSERTEQPTPRRLEKAREQGQIASSREVSTLFVLTAATLLLATAGPTAAELLAAVMRASFTRVAELGGEEDAVAALLPSLFPAGLLVLVPAAAFAIAALLAAAAQNAIVWTPHHLAPKLSRLSPLEGARRLLSRRNAAEFAKSLLKLVAAVSVATTILWPEIPTLRASSEFEIMVLARKLDEIVFKLLIAICAVSAIIAGLDYAFQRFDLLRRLRMSRRDIREELKETEGDPLIRQRLRAIRMERARRRMMAEVPKATVVVTNPTHYAVALRYRQSEDAVPQVVAKGVDRMAERIRDLARAHGVPVIENPPLARILYATVEPGKPIRPEQYEAVARVIALVMRLGRPEDGTGRRIS